MKKVTKLVAMLFAVVMLTGCVKYNIGMEVEKNGEFSLDVIMAIDKKYASSSSSTKEDVSAIEKKGFTCTEYTDDTYTGSKCTKKYKNIKEVSTDKEVKVELTDLISEDKEDIKYFFTKSGNTYKANFTIDNTSESGSSSSVTSGMDLKYYVTLPVKAKSHNAKTEEEKDGKYTYTWDFESDKLTEINFEWEMGSSIMLIVIIAVIVLVLLVVIVVVILMVSKGKKNNNMGQPMAQPMMGSAPMGPQPMPGPMGPQPMMRPAPMDQQMAPMPAAPAMDTMPQPEAPVIDAPGEAAPVMDAPNVNPEHPISYPSDNGSNM